MDNCKISGIIKIIYFIRAFNVGGAETFIFNTLSNIDINKFHIDFVLQDTVNHNERLMSLCKDKGCTIHFITPFEKNYLRSVRELTKILEEWRYDIIHIHANALINMVPIIAANMSGVKIALHSHNTRNNQGGIIGACIHSLNRWYLRNKKILRFACGKEAGKWMHGNCPYIILNNAINLNEYKYNATSREEIRKKLDIKDSFVIGNVSRFVEAKNHTFIVDIFKEVLHRRPNSKLMLLGDGPLFNDIHKKVCNLGLQNNVIFVGAVENASKYYSAFDCMLFPSLFEGLPFALVEAQASGVPIFASSCITRSVNITNTIKYIDLKMGACYWAQCLIDMPLIRDRGAIYHKMLGSIFDEYTEIKKLEEAYLKTAQPKLSTRSLCV